MARVALPFVSGLSGGARLGSPVTWLELALDYRCNLRCLGCHACVDTGESTSTAGALKLLQAGRERGCSRLFLGGGEPTLRDDLLRLVRAARAFGYDEVLLQTNGLRLSYPAYRAGLTAAGVTEVRLNVKSHRAEVHDRLSRAECHALLLAALDGLAALPVTVSADVLLTRSSMGDLPDLVPFYAARGVKRFFLWLLSAADVRASEVDHEVPTFHELTPLLSRAAEQASLSRAELHSFHTPPCTLPPALRSLYLPAASLGLVVTGPDGRSFPLESSSFEGGAFLESCGQCAERSRCGGPRGDYLRLHGRSSFTPIVSDPSGYTHGP